MVNNLTVDTNITVHATYRWMKNFNVYYNQSVEIFFDQWAQLVWETRCSMSDDHENSTVREQKKRDGT